MNFSNSIKLYNEAMEFIPGGVKGVRHPEFFIPGAYPIFFKRGDKGRVVDVDDNEYIDWMCSYGPNILGHGHPRMREVAMREVEKGFCLTLCQTVQNELAKKLIKIIPCAERVIFVTSGSDATTAAVRIAREHTRRDIVLRCGYQGWHDWCVREPIGVPSSAQNDVIQFPFGDMQQLEALIRQHANRIACVIMTPIGHDLRKPVVIPSKSYLEDVRKLTKANGIVLIFDEIRTGFRLAMGGAQEYFDVVPDMATFSKALGNGFPISVVAMRKNLDAACQRVTISATYFPNSTPMEAALATIDEIESRQLLPHMWKIGQALQDGLQKLADNYGVSAKVSGPAPLPFIHFEEDVENGEIKLGKATKIFYSEMIKRGVFLHPIHNWFVCGAHTDADVSKTLEAAEAAFQLLTSG